jgi:hypothetical protein
MRGREQIVRRRGDAISGMIALGGLIEALEFSLPRH